jgi:aryl-alcohol dehydrogenase-like predicted oxidoreductase
MAAPGIVTVQMQGDDQTKPSCIISGKERFMLFRNLGRTGLKVAALCLGGNVFGWTADERASFAVLDTYAEGGGNFIDTADVYSRWAPGHRGGESETILGNWMRQRGNREQMVIATKVGSQMGAGPNQRGLSRQHIMQAVEASLHRLQTEYIDLYLSHQDDPETPQEETMRAYDDLLRQGKVRYLGASNFSAWRTTRALWESERHGAARYVCVQPPYSLANREAYERELEACCRELGLGVMTYSSLASGFLSGKYRAGKDLPSSQRAEGVQKRYMNERGFAILEAMDRVAAVHDATPAQVALAWILARPGITAPIASATTAEQTRELLLAVDLKLEAEELEALDHASAWQQKP